MDISALLNPSSPQEADSPRPGARVDGHGRISQQYSSFFHPDHGQRIQRPQPMHPVIHPPQLVGGHDRQDPRTLFSTRSVQENHARRENAPLSDNRVPPIDLSSEAIHRMLNWEFGDPIPKGRRLTVPSYATPLEPPHRQETESTASFHQWLESSTRETHLANRNTDHPVWLSTPTLRRLVEPQPIGFTSPIYPRHPPRAGDMPPPSRPPRPEPQPVAQNKEKQKPTPNENELIACVDREVVLTEFENVAAHTAKCDLCNKRNSQGMSRCMSCGWQSCHPCTIARGCFRTHRAGGRLHTGPVRQEDLVMPEKVKGKKAKAKAKKETTTQTRKNARRALTSARRTSRKYSVASTGDGSGNDIETLLGGAHNLYSLSAAALGPMAGSIPNAFGQDRMASGLSRSHERRVDDAQEEQTSEDTVTRDSDPSDPDYDPGDSDSQEQMSKRC
ncbi:hypothetical protein ATEIFO6365_0007028600 [Aspergillus terreus]|uniref:Uncharacterized protein n=1 Tax=Aspergillus terreus TaxID=33178 RepID=A0A5M3Z4E8_ASPTE|nr:hypothetical protein ATETN484_0009028600 [Aspergillus terreus]GFF17737.1 hypothetical protein ATEIFO6365_0007028600 [Aspergillus terreus]